jgi:polyferredoxin
MIGKENMTKSGKERFWSTACIWKPTRSSTVLTRIIRINRKKEKSVKKQRALICNSDILYIYVCIYIYIYIYQEPCPPFPLKVTLPPLHHDILIFMPSTPFYVVITFFISYVTLSISVCISFLGKNNIFPLYWYSHPSPKWHWLRLRGRGGGIFSNI